MKYFLFLIFIFLLSCSNKSGTEVCLANSSWDDKSKSCVCDKNYHLEKDKCVNDELSSCQPNPCKEENKTICSIKEGDVVCSCEIGWANVNGKCMPDLCVEPNPCKEENRNICSLDENGKVICSCNENYHLDNDKCISDALSPCHPNPCIEEHKTRCLLDPQDNTKFTCSCDTSYHEDDGLCCQAYSHNESGVCVCNDKYIMKDNECKVICSEESIEAFRGECINKNQVCVQGKCIDNKCVNHSCPEHSSCATQNDQAVCYCSPGYHMDNNICCKEHSSNINGTCVCDLGYNLKEGSCIKDESNPCDLNVCNEKHKNKCVIDDSNIGYHCECNQGFTLDGNECKLLEVENCPGDLICLNSYCVESGNRENEQCLKDSDCHEFNPASSSYCNPSPVGGVCLGCETHSDCPNNTQCHETYHSCQNLCETHSDCPSGKCSFNLGICLIARCSSDEDCQNGSVCLNEGSGSTGLCKRIPCKETKCSEFNQNGSCENGKTCVYGVCTDSCTPNPCNKQEFKDVCSIDSNNKVVCSCRENYTENANGNCEPSVQECSDGFSCENNYCVNRNDSGFICTSNVDCGNSLTCSSNTLPSGLCRGCNNNSDCPGDNMKCLAGYCLKNCVMDSDCNDGMICNLAQGVCAKKSCNSSDDCGLGYVCDGGSGKCERTPCN